MTDEAMYWQMNEAMEDGTKPWNDNWMKPCVMYELWWIDEAMGCQIDEAMVKG